MLKHLAFIATVMLIVTTLTGCRKIGINGDLDGQWRIITIENLETKEISEPTNLFYCIYLHTVNLTSPSVAATANMTYSGKTLKLEFPTIQDATRLNKWGIYSTETIFNIERLNSSHLTLASEKARITLRKF